MLSGHLHPLRCIHLHLIAIEHGLGRGIQLLESNGIDIGRLLATCQPRAQRIVVIPAGSIINVPCGAVDTVKVQSVNQRIDLKQLSGTHT